MAKAKSPKSPKTPKVADNEATTPQQNDQNDMPAGEWTELEPLSLKHTHLTEEGKDDDMFHPGEDDDDESDDDRRSPFPEEMLVAFSHYLCVHSFDDSTGVLREVELLKSRNEESRYTLVLTTTFPEDESKPLITRVVLSHPALELLGRAMLLYKAGVLEENPLPEPSVPAVPSDSPH